MTRRAARKAIRLAAVPALVAGLLTLPAAASMARQDSSIMLDYETGQVLFADEPDALTYPASLTKMMTLFLVFDALDAGRLTPDTRLTVSARAASMPPTRLGLRPGATIRLEDAIMALVTRSANDIASAIGENLGGSEAHFAELMTARARSLGMSRTTFRNASGLPNPDQRTTARDIATLATHLIADHPRYYRYFSHENFVYAGRTIGNHNHLMSRYAGMDGIKTGFTNASGFNLAASAVRNGRRLVAVVLGGASAPSRDIHMASLLDRGFAQVGRQRRQPAAPDAGLPEVEQASFGPGTPGSIASGLAAAGAPDRALMALAAKAEARSEAEADADPVLAAVAAQKSATPRLVQSIGQPAPAPVLARKAVKVAAVRTAAVRVAAVNRPAPARRPAVAFGVELGSTYKNVSAARSAAQQAVQRAPGQLRGTFVSVSSVRQRKQTVYRAQLLGTDRDEAKQACQQLRRRGQACMVVQTSAVTVASN